ncbi:MAG: flavodoxin family protein [Lachnospiraceae bacterium]|nr:flavodoxin family protein [Lachnospiraceae bacterium]
MSKKVLVISSSPRKGGNSDILCDEFAKGAGESGHEVEKVFLKDYRIHYCSGCGYCVGNKGACSEKDDMEVIQEKMICADVIVFATPIYFYTMSGQMKTFIDRNCSFYTLLRNKEFYYIMTAADSDKAAMERTLTEFGGYICCLDGAVEKGTVFGIGAWEKGDIRSKSSMKEAFDLGKMV